MKRIFANWRVSPRTCSGTVGSRWRHCVCKVNSLPLCFFLFFSRLTNCFSLAVIHPRWRSTKAAALFHRPLYVNDSEGEGGICGGFWMTSIQRQFISPPQRLSLPPASRQRWRTTNSFQNLSRPRGWPVDGRLLQQGGCQKSQLAGSALRNLLRQQPISFSDSAQLWLGAQRRGSWMTGIVWLEKKYHLTLDYFLCLLDVLLLMCGLPLE